MSEQFQQPTQGMALPYLHALMCRFALLRSEFGMVTDEIGSAMFQATGRAAPVFALPEAGHHAMLGQPLILLTALRAVLADWDHSRHALGSRARRSIEAPPPPDVGPARLGRAARNPGVRDGRARARSLR